MFRKVGKCGKFQQNLTGWSGVDDLMLKHPGEVVRDKDGVEADREGRVDIRARAVADYPGVSRVAVVMGDQDVIGGWILLGEDFYASEVLLQAGATELVTLLDGIALGDEDDAMAAGKFGERSFDAGQQLNLLIGDGLGEAGDALMLLGRDGLVGELLETVGQRTAEAG